jgi:hypothetical protein
MASVKIPTPTLVNRQIQHYEEAISYPVDEFGVVPQERDAEH